MIGVYSITNPKKRVYIGQSLDIKSRFASYRRLSCKGQIRLYNSFLKYGVDKHIFTVITECEPEQLNDLERYYQELYNCLKKGGLNCHYVGTETRIKVHSEETKRKIGLGQVNRKPRSGFKLTDEHKQKIGLSKVGVARPDMVIRFTEMNVQRKAKGIANPFKGKNHSQETRDNWSLTRKGKYMDEENTSSKLVIDINTGVFYYSVGDVSRVYGINRHHLGRKLGGVRNNDTQFRYC